jgi:hypothetical protein
MNLLLESRFIEHFNRLVLGVQPTDALRAQRLAHRVDVAVEPKPWVDPLTSDQQRYLRALMDARVPLSDTWSRATRHSSARYVLTFETDYGTQVDLRVLDPSERVVPRRLRVPLAALSAIETIAVADTPPVAQRSRFPVFYPGAAYDVSERATGLRGRVVVSDGGAPPSLVPVRWPRVVARLAGGPAIAWAHGDQHGEFLLVLPPESIPAPAVQLPQTLQLDVTASGRKGLPAAPPPVLVRDADPYWDLPLEALGAPTVDPATDLVSLGQAIPADYNGSVTQSVTFSYSRIISTGVSPFDIT